MGFENRRSTRVKVDGLHLYFWTEGRTDGQGNWGQVANLSESGLALTAGQGAPKGQVILTELSLPSREKALRLFAEVVHAGREQGAEQRHELRLKFVDLQPEEKLVLRQFVMERSDPKRAASMGWGRAYFQSQGALEASYREMDQGEDRQWLEARNFLAAKEVGYLKRFQVFLEHVLGSRDPENFRLVGTKALRTHSPVWVELGVQRGPLQVLGKVLWCKDEKGEDAEAGVCLTAFQKEMAIRMEKGAA